MPDVRWWNLTVQQLSLIHILLDSQRKTQRFRVYQMELEHGETRAFAFGGIDALHKAGFQQPPAAEYTLVYDGEPVSYTHLVKWRSCGF